MRFAVVVFVNTLFDFRRAQLPAGLDDGALAVQPLRLDRVQPRRLDRQAAHADLAAPSSLDLAVVADPALTRLLMCQLALSQTSTNTFLPSYEHFLALRGEPLAQPALEVLGHLADRPALDEAPSIAPVSACQQPVAGQRLLAAAVGSLGRSRKALLPGPGVQVRLGQPRPTSRPGSLPVEERRAPPRSAGRAQFFRRTLGRG